MEKWLQPGLSRYQLGENSRGQYQMLATQAMGLNVKAFWCPCDSSNGLTTMNGVIDQDSMRIVTEVIRDLPPAGSGEWRELISSGVPIMLSKGVAWQ